MGTINIFIIKFCSSRYSVYTIENLRNKLTRQIQRLSLPRLNKYHSGDLTARINNDLNLIRNFLTSLSDYIYQPLIFILALTYAFILSWKLSLATVLVLAIALLLNRIATRPLTKISAVIQEVYARANSWIQDSVKGIYIIKSFNLEDKFRYDYKELQEDIYQKEMKLAKRSLYILMINILIIVLPIQIINLYGGRLTFIGEMSLGEFTAFLAIVAYLTNPVNRIIALISNLKVSIPGINRIKELLNSPVEETYYNHSDYNEKNIRNCPEFVKGKRFALEFKNVSFSFDKEKYLFHDLSFKLEKNKTLALLGPSGSGKTTILNLIAGFYKISAGEIKVFGKDISKISIKFLRSQISMVTQDTYIYPVSIYENIAYGRINASSKEIIEAAKKANAHQFILEQEDGYDTVIKEEGSNLSRGQKQRIAFARAILKDAPILLLDEATSALDSKNEEDVLDALDQFTEKKSVIMVAHRYSTINKADQMLVLEKGELKRKNRNDIYFEFEQGGRGVL